MVKTKNIKHICCVDSVIDGIVKLLTGDNGEKVQFLPLELFPNGIKEGDWLDLEIRINTNATEKGKRGVADLYKE
ncbi:MAG: DUF3006 domain-containing protein, partial [Synergistaceae bacterium]|nr:DUF3006 domain-containing protein [Synergistaceae bacterium]